MSQNTNRSKCQNCIEIQRGETNYQNGLCCILIQENQRDSYGFKVSPHIKEALSLSVLSYVKKKQRVFFN